MRELTKLEINEIVDALLIYIKHPKLFEIIIKATISAIMRRMDEVKIRSYAYENLSAVNTGDGLMFIVTDDRANHVLLKKKENLINGAYVLEERKRAPDIIRSYLKLIVALINELIRLAPDKPFLLTNPDDPIDEDETTEEEDTKKKYTIEEVAELITAKQLNEIMQDKNMKYFDDGIITIIPKGDTDIEYKLEVNKHEYYFTIENDEDMLSKSAGDYRSPEHREWLLITIIMLLNKVKYDPSNFIPVIKEDKDEDDCGCGIDDDENQTPPKEEDDDKDKVPTNPLDAYPKLFIDYMESLTMGKLKIIMETETIHNYLTSNGTAFSIDNNSIRVVRTDGSMYVYQEDELFMSINMLVTTNSLLAESMIDAYYELLVKLNVVE